MGSSMLGFLIKAVLALPVILVVGLIRAMNPDLESAHHYTEQERRARDAIRAGYDPYTSHVENGNMD